jgi:hypothetical protein
VKTLLAFNPRKMKDALHRYLALMMGQQARKTVAERF